VRRHARRRFHPSRRNAPSFKGESTLNVIGESLLDPALIVSREIEFRTNVSPPPQHRHVRPAQLPCVGEIATNGQIHASVGRVEQRKPEALRRRWMKHDKRFD
jgi:hypothetical protein